jgi:hypothetical protein
LENAFLGESADFTAVDNTGSCNSIVVSVFSQLKIDYKLLHKQPIEFMLYDLNVSF